MLLTKNLNKIKAAHNTRGCYTTQKNNNNLKLNSIFQNHKANLYGVSS